TLGYVGLAQFLPMVILILPAGDLSDRLKRHRILGSSWLGMALATLLLIWLTLLKIDTALPYFLVLAVIGVARAFSGPAMHSVVPLMVPTELLGRAIALNST